MFFMLKPCCYSELQCTIKPTLPLFSSYDRLVFQVGRAGSMVGGAGRRVGGVVGGVVGLVWGGRAAPTESHTHDEHGADETADEMSR